jgi:hypothetical protein
MAVNGHYLARRIQLGGIEDIRAYGNWVLSELIPTLEEFDGRASYGTIVALRQTTLNLFTVGLFHLLEQHIADLCHDGPLLNEALIRPPNDTKLNHVVKWYRRHFHLDLETLPNWSMIDELRLVANATKHGEGDSAQQLRDRRPQLLQDPVLGELLPKEWNKETTVRIPLAGEDLYITEGVFQEYSQAVNGFVDAIAAHFEHQGEETYPHES